MRMRNIGCCPLPRRPFEASRSYSYSLSQANELAYASSVSLSLSGPAGIGQLIGQHNAASGESLFVPETNDIHMRGIAGSGILGIVLAAVLACFLTSHAVRSAQRDSGHAGPTSGPPTCYKATLPKINPSPCPW